MGESLVAPGPGTGRGSAASSGPYRILHVNKFVHERGGAEAHMLDVATRQRARGHEVAVFGMQHPDNPPLPHDESFPSLVTLDPPPASAIGRVRALGRMVYSAEARRGLAEVVRAFRPDIVHLHNIYHQLSPSILRAVAPAVAVMTVHDYKLVCPSYQLLAGGQICTACIDGHFRHAVQRRCKDGSLGASAALAVESRVHRTLGAYGPVARFLCPSRFLRDMLERGGVYPSRLRVLSNFVDTARIPPTGGGGNSVVYFGRLSREKGVDVLVDAVADLPSWVRVDIIGDGPARAELEAQAALRAPGRVTFHGRLPRTVLFRALEDAAVAVLPSRWHENQPLSVLEAFAAALPVVATNLGGIPELVSEGETGHVVPPDDPGALAASLSRVLGNPERSVAMGQQARRQVVERHAPENHLAALEHHYADVLAAHVP